MRRGRARKGKKEREELIEPWMGRLIDEWGRP